MKLRLAAVLHLTLAASMALAATTAPTGSLEVRVLDAETGKPLPARLVLRAADGSYPGDRLGLSAAQWPHIEAHAIFTRGTETFQLPAGNVSVTAGHGMEYRTRSGTAILEPGKTATLELRLERVVDMRKRGWAAGDMHVHMLHGENQRKTSYRDVATTCEANGLDFVYVGQEYVGAGELDLAGYHAECEKVSSSSFRMFLGGERPKSLLGHQAIMGVENPFLFSEDPPYFKTARKVHAAGGVLAYVHPIRYFPEKQYQGQWLDFPGNNLARELVYDAYCGPSFDALSVLSDEPAHPNAWGLWFNLLNRGFRVPAFADSDACFDRPTLGMKAPGFWTTYFHVGPDAPLTHAALTGAVRTGRTFATTGPLLEFRIDGQVSGASLAPDGKPHTVTLEAWHPHHGFSLASTDAARKPVGISRVELIRNGAVVKSWEPGSPEVRLTHTITESEPCWYAARVYGTDARWQIGVTSPIYFGPAPAREARMANVRGRIYDFTSGEERAGQVEIRRDDQVLKSFAARGPFRVRMPLDAEVVVRADGFRPQMRNLLLDYGPIHRFLWYLESKDLANPDTFDRFEELIGAVELEFPLGHRLSGSYLAGELAGPTPLDSIRVLDGPERRTDGAIAVAAVLMDAEQISPGDTLHVAAIYRDEGNTSKLGPLVVEGRGYNPARPTAYGALKQFAHFERTWQTATDLGNGYRLVAGSLKVAEWVEAGPTGGIDLSIRARRGNGDAAYLGLHVPLGPTRRALSLSSGWPTMPMSWPDGRYGVRPFQLSSRAGRAAQSRADYRRLHLEVTAVGKKWDLLPARDGRGCPDADDAVYTGHFLDQVLAKETGLGRADPVRPQPDFRWPANLKVH